MTISSMKSKRPSSDHASNDVELGVSYMQQKRLLSFLMSKTPIPIPIEDERKPYGYANANFLSKIFFWWLKPLMNVGYKRTVQPPDLFYLTEDLKVQYYIEVFDNLYQRKVAHHKLEYLRTKSDEDFASIKLDDLNSDAVNEKLQDFSLPKFALLHVLVQTFLHQIIKSMVLGAICLIGLTSIPLLTKRLVAFVEKKSLGMNVHIGQGIGYAIGSTMLSFVSGLTMNHFYYQSLSIGIKVRSVLTHFVLAKSLRLNAKSRSEFDTGKITSLITTDLARVELAFLLQPLLLLLPIPLIISIVILLTNIGVSALISIAIFLVFLVGIAYSTKKLYVFREATSKLTDARVRLVKEIVNSLKTIKYYSWEIPFFNSIMSARLAEIGLILKIQTLRNMMAALSQSLVGIVTMIAFLVLFSLEGSTKDPASTFSSVQAFEYLGFMIFFIPGTLSSLADLLMAMKRIGSFLGAEEISQYEHYYEINDHNNDNAISIKEGNFEWEIFESKDDFENKSEEESTTDDHIAETINEAFNTTETSELEITARKLMKLRDINLDVKTGQFVVITGSIGSGKTSLLSAISGVMKCNSGSITINGSLLSAGASWIQNSTIRENILFGSNYDKEKYEAVIYACSLQSDLDILPGGDLTEVGEKGITLSGGQKARINLARAVYAERDILLLDDVLSAVDARVGNHIVDNCLFKLLKNKTRVLATHQLSLVNAADSIVFLNGDGTIDIGTMKELKSRNQGFNKLITFATHQEEAKEELLIEDSKQSDIDSEFSGYSQASGSYNSTAKGLTRRKTRGMEEIIEEVEVEDEDEDENEDEDEDEEGVYKTIDFNKDASLGRMIEEEERAVNSIKLNVYTSFIRAGAEKITLPGAIIGLLGLLTLATFTELFVNTWLSFWISNKFEGRTSEFYIGIYVMITFSWLILLTSEFVFLAHISTNASKSLNLSAIRKVLFAPMSFIDTTPLGRILNRFTKDTDALDNEIAERLRLCFNSFARIIGFVILDIIYLPWIGLVVPVLVLLLACVVSYYQATCREVKRLEAIQRSKVYNNHSEVFGGSATIKAYKRDEDFVKTNDLLMDNVNEASFVVLSIQRWLSIHLEVISSLVILLVSLLCVNRVFKINAASVGLLMTYTFMISSEITLFVKCITDLENDMNSVERLGQYAFHLPAEENTTREASDLTVSLAKAQWPSKGEIEFCNVNMAYRPGLPLVLKNIGFQVQEAEKIGICGRTGAGKSSIMSALFRLNELDSGSILIDGVDIASLELKTLRSNLSIIPQDPILFNGSIRRNLDPFKEHQDSVLWDAMRRSGILSEEELEQIKAQEVTENTELHKFHLDQEVLDEGANFSLGERQLISFSRALVKNSKILILDEATSSVDYETDSKIQNTINREFKNCTILCIAHRLRTIIHYDKILTLDRGEVKEFDAPINLFRNRASIFRSMCEKSGITELDFD